MEELADWKSIPREPIRFSGFSLLWNMGELLPA